jgi:hypothetical protein
MIQNFLTLLPAYVNMRHIDGWMAEMPCIKVGQRMIEEPNICVIWTYNLRVHHPWDKVGWECNDECLKQKYKDHMYYIYIYTHSYVSNETFFMKFSWKNYEKRFNFVLLVSHVYIWKCSLFQWLFPLCYKGFLGHITDTDIIPWIKKLLILHAEANNFLFS